MIAIAARQGEADLDRLAALLTEDSAGPDEDLLLVREIVDRAHAAGLPVTLRLEGDTSSVRGAVAHVAFRVVQEGLTNALRYAPGAAVGIEIHAGPATVDLSVQKRGPEFERGLDLGSGHGLNGLRERVAACGGALETGPHGAGGWSIHVRMPI